MRIIIGIVIGFVGYNLIYVHWAGWIVLGFGILMIIATFTGAGDYYCADCGQYLGNSPQTCSRCGCNRYTTKDLGIGKTTRFR